jgi:hypothetical protein
MSEDTDPTTPDDDAHEYEAEPVTLGEAEEALVFALAGVSQIADILVDLLLHQEDSRKYASQITQLQTMRGLVGSYAARLADHYHVTLERPFVRDTRNALALRAARVSAGLTLEALAEASGVDITRLHDAEDTDSRVDLTFGEWVRLAVVFEGHTLAEFQAQQKAKGVVKYLVQGDQMLESARGWSSTTSPMTPRSVRTPSSAERWATRVPPAGSSRGTSDSVGT